MVSEKPHVGIRSFVLSHFSLYIGKVPAFKTPNRGGATGGAGGVTPPRTENRAFTRQI